MKEKQSSSVAWERVTDYSIDSALTIKSVRQFQNGNYVITGEARNRLLSVTFDSQYNEIAYTKDENNHMSRNTQTIIKQSKNILNHYINIRLSVQNSLSPQQNQKPNPIKTVDMSQSQYHQTRTRKIQSVTQYDNGHYVISGETNQKPFSVTTDVYGQVMGHTKNPDGSVTHDIAEVMKHRSAIIATAGFAILQQPQPTTNELIARQKEFKNNIPKPESSLSLAQIASIDNKINSLKKEIPSSTFFQERKTDKLLALKELKQKCLSMSVAEAVDEVLKDDRTGNVLAGFFRNETKELLESLRDESLSKNVSPK